MGSRAKNSAAGQAAEGDTAEMIRVRGARTHNLQNIDVDIPRDRLVVITGVSGSGKSSLAFDTIYAEGQRQYVESLSVYARQFFEQMERPEVDLIDNLQPTISIDQHPGTHNPRSTVATITEIYDYMRLLWARASQAHCYQCGQPISQQTPAEIQRMLVEMPEGTKMMILAPLVRGRRGAHQDSLNKIRKAGFVRARVDGETYELDDVPELAPRKNHTIEAVVDRVIIREGSTARLAESIRLALRHGEGVLVTTILEQSPADKSPADKSPAEGESGKRGKPRGSGGVWRDLIFSTQYACAECKISYEELEPRSFSFNSPYGACPICQGMGSHEQPDSPQDRVTCADCGGARLRGEARGCHIGGRPIHEVTALTVGEARTFFESVKFDSHDSPIAKPSVTEIVKRLRFLDKVGAEYLTLDRSAETLSGGEMQRVRLATGIGSGLVNVCYLLDEPSIGLHPRDNRRLIDSLRDLQAIGNTVVVVEHDEAIMREADHLIDMGPGAGGLGGRLVAAGPPNQIISDVSSLTGQYLSGRQRIAIPKNRRRTARSRSIQIEGASTNNLQVVDVRFPLSVLVCVTGVSGSGKSSLVTETLSKALARRLTGAGRKPGTYKSLRGVNLIDRVVEVDQSPIGRTPRSNPATYTGAFDEIRKVFAGTKESKQRGFKSGRFSFNVKGGRCEKCQGQGLQKIEMNFLPDLYVTCEQCDGKRFNHQTLSVRYRDYSIADVLDLAVDDAATFFENHPVIYRLLDALQSVGLGYVTLGQPSTTLSGGEAQRIKLATELSRPNTGKTLYILDEPTTGLHFDDIRKLLAVLSRLVDLGNTVLVIEHHLDVIKCADWIIDLGPEGGQGGGHVVATGTPEEIAAHEASHTGRFLRDVLAR